MVNSKRAWIIPLVMLALVCAACTGKAAEQTESPAAPATVVTDGEASAAADEETAETNDSSEDRDVGEETGPDGTDAPEPPEEPQPEDFVCVSDYITDIRVELRYATDNNFTGQVIYGFQKAYLRYGTVKRLMQVQEALRQRGYCLKIWDAFRPVAAQFDLWEAYPVDAYVANPNIHYSSHNRGNTVDITMVRSDGSLVEMPTDFDDFTAHADRDYSDCSDAARENALLLETLMRDAGFKPYTAEWWHYSDVDEYPVEKEFLPEK